MLIALCLGQAQAQAIDWPARLIDHPVYLRQAWMEDKLSFDAAGQPTTEAHHGPLTLSGVKLTSVKISGGTMLLRGRRVVMLATATGDPMHRVDAISSTTQMPFTFHRQFQADEAVQFSLAADSRGDFMLAVTTIFADGLAQLAPDVPPYWRCYAASYFTRKPSATAAEDVLHCAEAQSAVETQAGDQTGDFTPVAVLETVAPHITHAAAQLQVSGEATVYATIDPQGRPSEFQVISAVGAGLDEDLLKAVSQFRFRPAMRQGKPVRAGFEYTIRYGRALPSRP